MSHRYGPTAIPLVPEEGDGLLRTVGDFFARWPTPRPPMRGAQLGGAGPPIVRVFQHDPEACTFSNDELPALFLYRIESERIQESIDVRMERSRIAVLYVPPPAAQEKQRLRFQFATKLLKVLRFSPRGVPHARVESGG